MFGLNGRDGRSSSGKGTVASVAEVNLSHLYGMGSSPSSGKPPSSAGDYEPDMDAVASSAAAGAGAVHPVPPAADDRKRRRSLSDDPDAVREQAVGTAFEPGHLGERDKARGFAAGSIKAGKNDSPFDDLEFPTASQIDEIDEKARIAAAEEGLARFKAKMAARVAARAAAPSLSHADIAVAHMPLTQALQAIGAMPAALAGAPVAAPMRPLITFGDMTRGADFPEFMRPFSWSLVREAEKHNIDFPRLNITDIRDEFSVDIRLPVPSRIAPEIMAELQRRFEESGINPKPYIHEKTYDGAIAPDRLRWGCFSYGSKDKPILMNHLDMKLHIKDYPAVQAILGGFMEEIKAVDPNPAIFRPEKLLPERHITGCSHGPWTAIEFRDAYASAFANYFSVPEEFRSPKSYIRTDPTIMMSDRQWVSYQNRIGALIETGTTNKLIRQLTPEAFTRLRRSIADQVAVAEAERRSALAAAAVPAAHAIGDVAVAAGGSQMSFPSVGIGADSESTRSLVGVPSRSVAPSSRSGGSSVSSGSEDSENSRAISIMGSVHAAAAPVGLPPMPQVNAGTGETVRRPLGTISSARAASTLR